MRHNYTALLSLVFLLFVNFSFGQTDLSLQRIDINYNGTTYSDINPGNTITLDNFTLGSEFRVLSEFRNSGDTSPSPYNNITFSFPDLGTSSYSNYDHPNVRIAGYPYTSTDMDGEYKEIYGSEWQGNNLGGDGYANYLMVESSDENNWNWLDTDNQLAVYVEPDSYGTFEIKVRAAASNQENWSSGWTYLPTSGDNDCLGFDAYSVSVVINGPEDYTITNESVTPQTIEVGDSFNVSCRQNSLGNLAEDRDVALGYFLSTNDSFGSSDINLGDDISAIGNNSYNSESEPLYIPYDTEPGYYYILFVADYIDAYDDETNENNNVEAVQIYVKATPDFSISSVGLPMPGGSVVAGGTVDWNCTVYNGGNAEAPLTDLVLYYSTSESIFQFANEVDREEIEDPDPFGGGLDAQESDSHSGSFIMPSNLAPGTYYIHFYADVDENVIELDELNNHSVASITVIEPPTPDLVVENESVSSTTLNPSSSFNVSCDVVNQGDGNAGSSSVAYYFSQNQTYESSNDTPLGSSSVSSLITGGSSFESASLAIPEWADGTYYILFIADKDDDVNEQNNTQNFENNNIESVQISVEPVTGNASISVTQDSNLIQGAQVKVYLSDTESISQITDAAGNTIFNLPVQNPYFFDVFNQEPDNESKELWGSSEIVYNLQNNTYEETVNRSYPYVGSINGKIGPTEYDLATEILPPGQTVDIQLFVNNNYFTTYNSRITLWLDRNLDGNNDFTSSSTEFSTPQGVTTVSIPVLIDQSWADQELIVKAKVETFINNSWRQTDFVEFNEYNWSLNIGNQQDTTPPYLDLENSNPLNGDFISTNFINEVGIFLQFSEPIDETTLNSSTFILTDDQNNQITGSFDYSFGGLGGYYFHPSIDLEYNTEYLFTLNSSISD